MQTETSRLTSGTETETRDFAHWSTESIARHLALHKFLLARKGRDRTPSRSYRQQVIRQRDQLQAELDRRAPEQVEARQLRDGDTIVSPSGGGETIPVLMATRYGDLVMIWTNPDKGFVLSPGLLVQIKRRDGGDEDENRDFAASGHPHFSGGYCDDRHCAGSSAATYDGHWVWKTAEAWARDHHADGEVCSSPNGCDDLGCRKAGA